MAIRVSKEDFVKNFITSHSGMCLFGKAYRFAEKCHDGHKRKDGTPYIGHPNEVCYMMILLGITKAHWLSVAIGHDTVEELYFKNGIVLTKAEIARELNWQIAKDIYTLTRFQKDDSERYFKRIEGSVGLVIVKTIDRFVNMRRSMFDVYGKSRMERYIFETEEYILPMSERIINQAVFPEYENPLRAIRSSIKGILEGTKHYVKLMDHGERGVKSI